MMAGGDVDGEGAARRRRQRRLRSWLKHERQSVAMALAEYTHHASRGQTRARAREEVEHVPHYALRGQKTPPPGERPAPLGPQRSDRTVRHSAGEPPLLVVPSLRGADGVDGTTVSFLLAANLKLQKEAERFGRRGQERARVLGACLALPRPRRLEEEEEKEEEEKTSSCSSASTRLSTSL